MRRRELVSCRDLVELVDDYLDGSLDRQRSAAVTAHLAACGDCTAYVAQVRATLLLLAAPADVAVDRHLARLRAALAADGPDRPSPPRAPGGDPAR